MCIIENSGMTSRIKSRTWLDMTESLHARNLTCKQTVYLQYLKFQTVFSFRQFLSHIFFRSKLYNFNSYTFCESYYFTLYFPHEIHIFIFLLPITRKVLIILKNLLKIIRYIALSRTNLPNIQPAVKTDHLSMILYLMFLLIDPFIKPDSKSFFMNNVYF